MLAMVGNTVITFYDVQQASANMEAAARKSFNGAELEKQILNVRKQVLDALINKELIYMEFVDMKAQVPQALLQERLNSIVDMRANGNVHKFEEMLMAEGRTMKEFKERLYKEIAVELLVREKTARGNLITDDEIDKFYESKKSEMVMPTRYKIAVIQIGKHGKYAGKTTETVDSIIKQLKDGAPFEELAKKYSEGSNAEKGGELDWMTSPTPKLQAVLNTLQVGQTSSTTVDLGERLYIVKLVDFEKGGIAPLSEEMRRTIRKHLETLEEQRRYEAFVKTLYVKYPVRRMDGQQ